MFLKTSQNSLENTCVRASFLNKVADLRHGDLTQVLSCEFCEIFKNIFFIENTSGGCFCVTTERVCEVLIWSQECLLNKFLSFR